MPFPETQGAIWRPQTFSHIVTASEQIERLNSSGGIAVDFDVGARRAVHLAFKGGQSKTLSIWTTESHHGFRSTPKISADLFTLRFVTQGSLIRDNLHSDAVVSRVGFGTFVDFEDMKEERATTGFSAVSATLSRGALMAARSALDDVRPNGLPRFAPFVELRTVALRVLRHTLVTLHSRVCAGAHELDLIAPILEELLVLQLISAWPIVDGKDAPVVHAASRYALRQAVDYIEANLSRRMTMSEIANASGVGVRALQIAFKRDLGCSPISYLIDRRLDRVHTALQTPGNVTIREVATQWGFTHMSDFSKRYRERFGFSPSASGMT